MSTDSINHLPADGYNDYNYRQPYYQSLYPYNQDYHPQQPYHNYQYNVHPYDNQQLLLYPYGNENSNKFYIMLEVPPGLSHLTY